MLYPRIRDCFQDLRRAAVLCIACTAAACGGDDGGGGIEPDAGPDIENDAGPDPRLTTVDCPTDALSNMNSQCGRFDVSESNDFEIGYAVVPAAGTPAADALPLVYLIGGPGPSGVILVSGVLQEGRSSSFMRKDRDVVLVDYRGVGLSEPTVACDQPTGPEELAVCKAAVDAAPITFDDFRSAEYARDIDALLGALQMDSVILYGGSYGTRVALTMMRDAPGRLSHVVLDGVFPPEVNGLTESATAPLAALDFVAERCSESVECQQALGDTRAQIEQIAATLAGNELAPRLLEGIATLAGHRAAPLLINTLAAMDQAEIIAALANLADVSYVDVSAENNPGLISGFEDRVISVPMGFGIVCSEEAAFMTAQPFDDAPFNFADVVDDLFDGFEGGADFPPDQAPLICGELGVGAAPAVEIEPVSSAIPTLVLSGIRDMQTSPVWGARAASRLADSTHLVFPLVGHIVTSLDSCGQDLMAQFVANPATTLDRGCLDSQYSPLTLASDDVLAEFSSR